MTETRRTNALKQTVQQEVDRQSDKIIKLSHRIHDNPELGFREENASSWICAYLKAAGFSVEKGVSSLPTAFRASVGSGKPVIAFLAEYDALPELGHACGHNIIATASVAAGVACLPLVEQLSGTVRVIGTPGEELLGGKIDMVASGMFKDVDVAMLVHPGNCDLATVQALACVSLEVEFFGKASHAAASPQRGINALDAMIVGFSALNGLRQQMPQSARVHGVIVNGGEAPNIIPDHTEAHLLVRTSAIPDLQDLQERVLNCFSGAAIATGCRLEHRWGERVYAPLKNNLTLARLFSYNLESLGRAVAPLQYCPDFGSTDMGNVSQVVPAIHPSIAIAGAGVSTHSHEFAVAAVSEMGDRGLLDSAKALAMTAVDLLSSPRTITDIKKEFRGR
jgi:amidohydrolase